MSKFGKILAHSGALGIVWLVGWCIVATNVPDENAFISVRETLYLREVIQRKKVRAPISNFHRAKLFNVTLERVNHPVAASSFRLGKKTQ